MLILKKEKEIMNFNCKSINKCKRYCTDNIINIRIVIIAIVTMNLNKKEEEKKSTI